jgi:hypothetical protein
MSDFTDTIRKAYEAYLLGDKAEAFSLLIPGTKHHYYLSIIDALKRERHSLSKDTLEMIDHFKKNFRDEDVTKIHLQKLFLQYDGAKDDSERDSIIQELDQNYVYGYYNHSKPADVKRSKGSQKESKSSNQSFKQEEHFDEKKIVKDLESKSGQYYNIPKLLYNKFNFNKMSENDFSTFLENCEHFANMENVSFWEKLVTTFDQNYKKNKHYNPAPHMYDKFTHQQLQDLGEKEPRLKKDSHFIGKIFEKQCHFELDDENKDTFTLEERRSQLQAMYKCRDDLPQSLKSNLLLEILENGVKLDIYDKDYFIEYLKNPLKNWYMSKSQTKKRELHDHVWQGYIHQLNNREGGRMDAGLDKKLFKKYLEQFYLAKGDLDEFKEYFDQDFLVELLEEFEFMAGKEIKKEKIDAKKFEKLTNQVFIDLLECNKSVFKREDRVRLLCEIKNVATLHVKIFEFNSENYYRKNLAPFRTDVNLDGLVTAHEEKHEFKEPAQKKFRQVFEFPQLDEKVGLFVIEFISNGYSSRAVIKKGSLSLIYKSTVAGQVGYILDENKQI